MSGKSADEVLSKLNLLSPEAWDRFAADFKDFKDAYAAAASGSDDPSGNPSAAMALSVQSFISQVSGVFGDSDEWNEALKINVESMSVEQLRASRQAYDDQRKESEASTAAAMAAANAASQAQSSASASAAAAGAAASAPASTSVLEIIDDSGINQMKPDEELKAANATAGKHDSKSDPSTPVAAAATAAAAAAAVSSGSGGAGGGSTETEIDPNAIREANLPPLAPTQLTYSAFVTNLSNEATESEVREAFKSCADLYEVFIARDRLGAGKGFGFLHFLTDTGRQSAVRLAPPPTIRYRTVKVYPADNKNHVFIGNVPMTLSEPVLKQKLEEMAGTTFRDLKKNEKGFAFATFFSYRAAESALVKLTGATLEGRQLQVQSAKNKKTGIDSAGANGAAAMGGPAPSDGATLFVRNLGQASDALLRSTFGAYGPLKEIRVVKNAETGENKGYGFVEFEQQAHARAAMDALNNTALQTAAGPRTITLQFQRSKNEQQAAKAAAAGARPPPPGRAPYPGARSAAPPAPYRYGTAPPAAPAYRPPQPTQPTTMIQYVDQYGRLVGAPVAASPAPPPPPAPAPVPTPVIPGVPSFAHHTRYAVPAPFSTRHTTGAARPASYPAAPSATAPPPARPLGSAPLPLRPSAGVVARPAVTAVVHHHPPSPQAYRAPAPTPVARHAPPPPPTAAATHYQPQQPPQQPQAYAPPTAHRYTPLPASAPVATPAPQYYQPAAAPTATYTDQYGRVISAPVATQPPPAPTRVQPRYAPAPPASYAPANGYAPPTAAAAPVHYAPATAVDAYGQPLPSAPSASAVPFEAPTMAYDERSGQYVPLSAQQQWDLQQQYAKHAAAAAAGGTVIGADGVEYAVAQPPPSSGSSSGRSRRQRSSRSRSPSSGSGGRSRDRSRSRSGSHSRSSSKKKSSRRR